MGRFNFTASRHRQRIKEHLRRLLLGLGLIFTTNTLGILGFMFIEGYTFGEAFYMTIITLSTVGYGELRPLSEMGRWFSSLLIITNIGLYAYAISVLSRYLVDGSFRNMLQDFRIMKKLDKYKNHIIVCGYGRYGSEVCDYFKRVKMPFVIIENNKKTLEILRKKEGLLFLSGDATNDDILEEAGIKRAKALISTLPDDAENVYVVLSARQLNDNLCIVSRSTNKRAERKLLRAGADHIITPERIGGFYMATLIDQPDLVEFFRVVSFETDVDIRLEEIDFERIPEPFVNKTIKELNIRKNTGANIIGMKQPDGTYLVNPPPETGVQPGMRLIVLGNKAQIDSCKAFWNVYANEGVIVN